MRIAILNWRDLEHQDSGGAEVFVDEVARRWTRSGQEVTLFSSRRPELPSREEHGGVTVRRVGNIKNGTHHLLAPRAIELDGRFDAILESINTFPYQTPLRRSKVRALPLVHQMARDVWREHLPRPLASAAAFAEPHLYRPYRKVAVLAVSESTKQDLAAAGLRDVSVVPQGGLGRRSHLPRKETKPTFIFVGRLSPNKRPDHAVAAFEKIKARLPEAVLWIVGDGEMRTSLASTRTPGVALLGRLPREELLERIGRAHALLATSVREGWGLVVTEANALGTPAVAYAVPGLVDSVKPRETGLLVDPCPESLADAAVALIEDQDRYMAFCSKARAWGEGHSWDITAADLLTRLHDCSRAVGENV